MLLPYSKKVLTHLMHLPYSEGTPQNVQTASAMHGSSSAGAIIPISPILKQKVQTVYVLLKGQREWEPEPELKPKGLTPNPRLRAFLGDHTHDTPQEWCLYGLAMFGFRPN